MPNPVDVVTDPETVVVTVLVAVVLAAQAVQLVQGAEVQAPDDAQGPHPLLFPALPKGPTPPAGFQPPCPP